MTLDLLSKTVLAMNSKQQSACLGVVLARYKAGRGADEAVRAAVADVLSLSDMLTAQAGMISQGLDHGKALALAREIASQIDGAHVER